MRKHTGVSRATIEIKDESKRKEIIDIVESKYLKDYFNNDPKKIGEGIYEGNAGIIEISGAGVLRKLYENDLLQYLDKYEITKYIDDGTTEEIDSLHEFIEDCI
ncbi:MAG: hypothetical protein Q4F88_05935 [Eubacteriales bacterium]|nr:hypothetical protein [Eubacteriales bacterium]